MSVAHHIRANALDEPRVTQFAPRGGGLPGIFVGLGQRTENHFCRYKARVERLGIERLQEIARENGKLGGRPKGTGKKQPKKGAE